MRKTILILGATGGVGGAVARAMLRRDWRVVALVRDPARAAATWRDEAQPIWVRGDAMVREDVVRAAEGASVILHAVNPPGYRRWEQLVLPMIDNSIAAARAAGGARVVLPGTIYNYDPALSPVVDEHTPQQAKAKKGRIRIAMEQRLADAAPEVPSLVVRAGDFFGPVKSQSWFHDALAKPPYRRIVNPGRRGVGHAWAYLPDLAEAIARLIEVEPRLQRTERVQFAGLWDTQGDTMVQAIRRALRRPKLREVGFLWWLMQLLAPFGGFPREVGEVKRFWRAPLRLDNRRLEALIGPEPHTPLDEAVAASLSAAA